MKKQSAKFYFLLLFAIFIYALSMVFAKFAAGFPFLSGSFILYYCFFVFLLLVYAVLWQRILERISLSIAYTSKSISIIFTMLLGKIIFHEAITWNMMIGAGLIMTGVFILVTGNE